MNPDHSQPRHHRFKPLINLKETEVEMTTDKCGHGSIMKSANLQEKVKYCHVEQKGKKLKSWKEKTIKSGRIVVDTTIGNILLSRCYSLTKVKWWVHLKINQTALHVGASDVCREQSEVLQQDFIELGAQFFTGRPRPAVSRGINRFSRLLGLNTWLRKTCGLIGINSIENLNLFWGRRHLFMADGLHPE